MGKKPEGEVTQQIESIVAAEARASDKTIRLPEHILSKPVAELRLFTEVSKSNQLAKSLQTVRVNLPSGFEQMTVEQFLSLPEEVIDDEIEAIADQVEQFIQQLEISGEAVFLQQLFGEDDFLQPISPHYAVQRNQALAEKIDLLKPNFAQVLRLRFGIGTGNPMSFEEIGAELDISTTRAGQIYKAAMKLLRHPLRSRELRRWLPLSRSSIARNHFGLTLQQEIEDRLEGKGNPSWEEIGISDDLVRRIFYDRTNAHSWRRLLYADVRDVKPEQATQFEVVIKKLRELFGLPADSLWHDDPDLARITMLEGLLRMIQNESGFTPAFERTINNLIVQYLRDA